jgi:hypothetical protein
VSNYADVVFESHKANCVGYAALFCSIGHYIIKKQNLESKYQFKHHIGKLDLFGYDLHSAFNSSYFKDHDYNEVIDLSTGEKTFLDLTVADYLWISEVSSDSK